MFKPPLALTVTIINNLIEIEITDFEPGVIL
jgi:hypothetical protein